LRAVRVRDSHLRAALCLRSRPDLSADRAGRARERRNDLKTQLARRGDLAAQGGASEDAGEGVTAFREKRAPRYKGR